MELKGLDVIGKPDGAARSEGEITRGRRSDCRGISRARRVRGKRQMQVQSQIVLESLWKDCTILKASSDQ